LERLHGQLQLLFEGPTSAHNQKILDGKEKVMEFLNEIKFKICSSCDSCVDREKFYQPERSNGNIEFARYQLRLGLVELLAPRISPIDRPGGRISAQPQISAQLSEAFSEGWQKERVFFNYG